MIPSRDQDRSWTPVAIGITIDLTALGLSNGTYAVTEYQSNGTTTILGNVTIAGAPVVFNYAPASDSAACEERE